MRVFVTGATGFDDLIKAGQGGNIGAGISAGVRHFSEVVATFSG